LCPAGFGEVLHGAGQCNSCHRLSDLGEKGVYPFYTPGADGIQCTKQVALTKRSNIMEQPRKRGSDKTFLLCQQKRWISALTVFSLILMWPIAATAEVKESVSESESKISLGEASFDVPAGSLVIDYSENVPVRQSRKDRKYRFIRSVSAYLARRYAKQGYDKQAATMAAEALYDASLTQKLLADGHLAKVADIKGVYLRLNVDNDGRIHFAEIAQYQPRQEIYCERQGRPSVPKNSAIPCLTKNKIGKGRGLTKLPPEALKIVQRWRGEFKKMAQGKSKVKRKSRTTTVWGRHINSLVKMSDAQLYALIWSASKTMLAQQFTFLPFYIHNVDWSTIPYKVPSNQGSFRLLAGFTIDEEEQWKKRWSKWVDLCWLCPGETYYYVEPWYNYSYLLGLRVPLRLDLASANVTKTGATYNGDLTVDLKPFDGVNADYMAANLPNNLVYGGREVLASLCHKDCDAGIRGDVPGPDLLPIGINVGEVNLLQKLPGNWPIKTGHINPPDVGQNTMLGEKKINFDLLFGNGDVGVVGAKIFPWLRLDMEGEGKSIGLDHSFDADCSAPSSQNLVWNNNPNPKTVNFQLLNDNKTVTLERHKYIFDLKLRPGFEPYAWVDLSVWDDEWSWGPWYLPWGLQSPNFTLEPHAHTYCGVAFNVTG